MVELGQALISNHWVVAQSGGKGGGIKSKSGLVELGGGGTRPRVGMALIAGSSRWQPAAVLPRAVGAGRR